MNKNNNMIIDNLVKDYEDKKHLFEWFMESVVSYFSHNPRLTKGPLPILHSFKCRTKDSSHLREKLNRKIGEGRIINQENLFNEITDLAGVRLLHLYQGQFLEIHNSIKTMIDSGEWTYVEPPIAYTWDPESQHFFESLGIQYKCRDSYYTSIHYLVKPNNAQSIVCCEIQVRTLFEEIWGEINHSINYPHATNSVACKEQLRVLSKFISTGTRLADSIIKTHEEYEKTTNQH